MARHGDGPCCDDRRVGGCSADAYSYCNDSLRSRAVTRALEVRRGGGGGGGDVGGGEDGDDGRCSADSNPCVDILRTSAVTRAPEPHPCACRGGGGGSSGGADLLLLLPPSRDQAAQSIVSATAIAILKLPLAALDSPCAVGVACSVKEGDTAVVVVQGLGFGVWSLRFRD